jgi:6,7-dimethyl-8-ribityllumazine synthase
MSNYEQSMRDISNIKKNIKIAFVVAEFNKEFTSDLEAINIGFLKQH